MNGNEIRTKFLEYFAERGHEVVDSSSLVPNNDPTLLFVNSGMVQFKKVFTGEEKREYVRATSSQRCVRAGGKHNDLENVGYTARHHTFFEMLGNFSFGDYFKEDAIKYAWEFLTKVVGVPVEHLWVSIFDDDDEAQELWEKVEDLREGRIVRMGESENFWAMGDTGPCGPCSEIHYDQGPEAGCGKPDCKLGCDCDRFLELWNLVFMQFERDEEGTLTPLPKPSIDTGMGLERITAVMQGKYTNYDSDIFTSVMRRISKVCGIDYGNGTKKSDTAFKVIVDHCRAAVFLIADGVMPSNEGRGYVLRRIMRRAIRYGRTLGLRKPFLAEIAEEIVGQMKGAYPHLLTVGELLDKVINNEEERFLETIDHGIAMLEEELQRLGAEGGKVISGEFIFRLYDTYGFPKDIVRDMAFEEGITLDEAGFKQAMDAQRAQSKKSWHGAMAKSTKGMRDLPGKAGQTEFVGYEHSEALSQIKAVLDENGEAVSSSDSGQKIMLACAKTPFYAESGGQAGDRGEIVGPNGRATVADTIKTDEGIFLHKAKVIEGKLAEGDEVTLRVAVSNRKKIEANHSATHLLQAALRQVLGEHVKQSGSLVENGRLRFDFTNFSPLSVDELKKVEDLVNNDIRANLAANVELMDKEAAQGSGVTALFGEKYGQEVRVVTFGEKSKELCGGTHVSATGEIGMFKIVSETGIAAGIRRIFAVTGDNAFSRYREVDELVSKLAEMLKGKPEEVKNKVENIIRRQKELEKEVSELTAKLSLSDLDGIIGDARTINGIKVSSAVVMLDSPKTLREIGDKVRDKLGSGVAVLGGELQGKVALLAIVSKDLTKQCHAGKIIKEVAGMVGGSGGGRPDMAQAGGSMVDKLPGAIEAVYEIVEKQLS